MSQSKNPIGKPIAEYCPAVRIIDLHNDSPLFAAQDAFFAFLRRQSKGKKIRHSITKSNGECHFHFDGAASRRRGRTIRTSVKFATGAQRGRMAFIVLFTAFYLLAADIEA